MNELEKELEKVKFRSFGIVSYSNRVDSYHTLQKLEKDKHETIRNGNYDVKKLKMLDDEITSEVLTIQKEHLEKQFKTFESIKNNKGIAAATFKLKESVIGLQWSRVLWPTRTPPIKSWILS